MKESFKKGQIVVKRLNIAGVNRSKLRHMLKFGTDVIVEGKTVTALGKDSMFVVSSSHSGGKNGKPKQIPRFLFEGIKFITYDALFTGDVGVNKELN